MFSANRNLPKQVVVVTYDGLCTFEFGIVVEVFGLPRPEFEFPWYGFEVCSATGSTFRAVGGIKMVVQSNLCALERATTVIVPGWREPYEDVPTELTKAIRAAHARGTRVVSICGGAFVLAAAGILDDRSATTHWRLIDRLARAYPRVRVKPNILYTIDGNVLTSAGSSAGIDLCLHIVALDFGENAAWQVAQRLVAHPPREDIAPQYRPFATPHIRNSRLAKIMNQLQAEMNKIDSVAEMARVANISERSLHRKFKTELGLSPSEWLSKDRMRRAMQFLLHSDLPIEKVADQCGFSSTDVFRKKFKSFTGMNPSTFRMVRPSQNQF